MTKGGRVRKREILPPLIYSPKGYKGQGWARVKPGTRAWSFIWVSSSGATRAQTLAASSAAFSKPLAGS